MVAADVQFALLTPCGAGGVAVVAACGDGRREAVARLLVDRDGRPLRAGELVGGGPRLACLWLSGAAVDDVLVVDRPAAGSIELHLHGSATVVSALEDHVGFASPAGEPPAVRLLRDARSDPQLALALEQLASEPFESLIARLRALDPERRRTEVDAVRARTVVARALATPFRCVLAGRQNAGKSTLLNRLLFDERALTGDLPGLTRDPVHASTTLSGYPYDLVDTAGEGPSVEEVDRRAQARGRRERAAAAWILVVDGSRGFGGVERRLAAGALLVVRNKADLPPHPGWPALRAPVVRVTCVDPAAAPGIRTEIGEALRRARALPAAPVRGVGGPAALDDAQQAALDELDVR